MFNEGQLVEVIGSFIVKEITDEYTMLDPFEKGTEELTTKYNEQGFAEVDSEGHQKSFDGFQLGDFFKFNGRYKVVRSNDVFTKLDVVGNMISIPNHKLLEVE